MAQPNIILIYCDDIGFNEIGAYQGSGMPDRDRYDGASVHTPHIDSLARDGAMLSRFYVTSAVCTPSRYSILTGRYASRSPTLAKDSPPPGHATVLWNTFIDPAEGTIGNVLQSMGYRTGFVGKWHCGQPPLDLDQNRFDKADLDSAEYNQALASAYSTRVDYLSEGFGFDVVDRVYFGNREAHPEPVQFHNLEWLAEGAENFIGADDDRPFFLNLSFSTPHEDQFVRFHEQDPLVTPAGVLEQHPKTHMPPREGIPERLRRVNIDERTAMTTWQDDCVGAILETLEEKGLAENTVVIFTSDHQARGKYMCYEGCRVPCLIKWSGTIAPGIRLDALCANIDLVATFSEWAGGAMPPDYCTDGKSFAQLLHQHHPQVTTWRNSLLLEISNIRGIVTDEWKYIACRAPDDVMQLMEQDRLEAEAESRPRYVGWDGRRNPHHGYEREGVRYFAAGSFPNYFCPDQLYNLKGDVMEQNNVAAEYPGKVAELRASMREEIGKLPHAFGEFE